MGTQEAVVRPSPFEMDMVEPFSLKKKVVAIAQAVLPDEAKMYLQMLNTYRVYYSDVASLQVQKLQEKNKEKIEKINEQITKRKVKMKCMEAVLDELKISSIDYKLLTRDEMKIKKKGITPEMTTGESLMHLRREVKAAGSDVKENTKELAEKVASFATSAAGLGVAVGVMSEAGAITGEVSDVMQSNPILTSALTVVFVGAAIVKIALKRGLLKENKRLKNKEYQETLADTMESIHKLEAVIEQKQEELVAQYKQFAESKNKAGFSKFLHSFIVEEMAKLGIKGKTQVEIEARKPEALTVKQPPKKEESNDYYDFFADENNPQKGPAPLTVINYDEPVKKQKTTGASVRENGGEWLWKI